MILTCPECATGYFVDDAQIGPGGRKVRCASCGARWTATPGGAVEAAAPHDPAPAAPEATVEPGAESLTAGDLPRAFRSRVEEEKRMRRAAVTGAVWAGAGLIVVAIIGAAIFFRESVVHAWPQTASVYAAIGLPVNSVGLVIEDVRADPSLEQGHAVLAVSGVIRNVVDRVVSAPPLRISLMNAQGKRVAGQIDALANARIPPGETRHFVTAIFDPPFSAHDLLVEFAVGAKPDAVASRTTAGGSGVAPLQLRGPAGLDPTFSNSAASDNSVAAPASPAVNAAAQ